MKWSAMLLAVLMAVLSAGLPTDTPYLVLVDPGREDEYLKAAEAMAAIHDGAVRRFDPAAQDALPAMLKTCKPRFVVFVLPPEKIDVDLCHAILETATRVDEDPFTDFEYGFVTGRDGGAALRFVLNIAAARSRAFGKEAALFGSWEGAVLPGDQPLNALGALGFSATVDLLQVSAEEAERKAQAREALSKYRGKDVLLFFSHGYPDEMVGCFRAKDLREWKIDLSPAVLVNCACYNGAPGRWFAPGPEGMKDMGLVATEDSVALAILDAGPSAYVAGIDPWHGPLANQVFCYIADDGLRLGEAAKRMFDRLALDFLPDRVRFASVEERRSLGEGRDNRRHNGAGMILYGDPSFAPFGRTASRRMFAEKLQTDDGTLHVRLGTRPLIKEGAPGVDFMLPLNRLIDYYSVKTKDHLQELRLEIYRVIPLAEPLEAPPALRVVSARSGDQDVPCKQPQLVLEEGPEGRLLHIRVPLDASPLGNLWPMLIAWKGIAIELRE